MNKIKLTILLLLSMFFISCNISSAWAAKNSQTYTFYMYNTYIVYLLPAILEVMKGKESLAIVNPTIGVGPAVIFVHDDPPPYEIKIREGITKKHLCTYKDVTTSSILWVDGWWPYTKVKCMR